MNEHAATHSVLGLVKWLLIPASILAGAWLIAPVENRTGFVESIKRLGADKGQLCLDYLKVKLKDPDSASVIGVREIANDVVSVTYRAKNSFGAFVSSSGECAFEDGKVSQFRTNSREVEAILDKVEEELNERPGTSRSDARGGSSIGNIDP